MGSAMRGVLSAGVVILTISLTVASDVSLLEDDALGGGCTQAQVDAAVKQDAEAKGALKAANPPAAGHAPLVTAAEDASKKLQELRANPACKKLMAANSPVAKVKNAEKQTKVDAKAAKESEQKKQMQADETRKKMESKKEQAEKKGAQNEQLEALKKGGVEAFQKIRMKQKDAKDRKYLKLAGEETTSRHNKAVQDMKNLYKQMQAELAEKTAAKLAKVKADAAAEAVKVMANAKEEGQKTQLRPAAIRETRIKKEEHKQAEKQLRQEKSAKKARLLVERKNDINNVRKDIVAAKDAKIQKNVARLKNQKQPTNQDIKNAEKAARAVAAKAATKASKVDTGKLKPWKSPEDKSLAKAAQRLKQVGKPSNNSPGVRGLEKTKSPHVLNAERKKAAAKTAQQHKQQNSIADNRGPQKNSQSSSPKKEGDTKASMPDSDMS